MFKKILSFLMCSSLVCILSLSCKSNSSFQSSNSLLSPERQTTTTDKLFQIVNPECSEVGVLNIEGTSFFAYKCPNKDGMIYTQKWEAENTGDDITSLCAKVTAAGATVAYVGYRSSQDFIRLPLEVLVCFPETDTRFKGIATSVNPTPIQ